VESAWQPWWKSDLIEEYGSRSPTGRELDRR
jgi:hypothetical protein